MRVSAHGLIRCVSGLICIWAMSPGAAAQTLGPLLGSDLSVNTSTTFVYQETEVAFDGSRYLVVWEQSTDSDFFRADIYGRFIDLSGSMSEPFLISNEPGFETEPSVAFNGTSYLVVYSGLRILGQLVSPTGALVGAAIPLSAPRTGNRHEPEVASDGTDFLTVWRDSESGINEIVGQLVSGGGALIGNAFVISTDAPAALFPEVGFGGDTYLVTWSSSGADLDVLGALVSTAGAVSAPIEIATAADQQGRRGAGISFDGTNFLVVFDDLRFGSTPVHVFGARVSEDGVLVDGPPSTGGIDIATTWDFMMHPHVVFNGTEWLVVWGGNLSGGGVGGSRVDSAGVVVDPSGMRLSVTTGGTFEPFAAFDGLNYLITWRNNLVGIPRLAQLVGPLPPNGQPVAHAGPDQMVEEGDFVSLDGSNSSDPDGDPLSFQWDQLAGPAAPLNVADPSRPTFTAPPVPLGGATLTFGLIVSDGDLVSAQDVVDITVKNVNHPPVADAGADQVVGEGAPVILDGSNSYDPDGEGLSYSWTQTSGQAVVLSGAAAPQASFIAPFVGSGGETLAFELSISDGIDNSFDVVEILVENINHPPLANAGADQTKNEGSLVQLDGSLSSDADADPLTYSWTQVSGAGAVLSSPSSATPTFTAPAVGPGGDELRFELTVDDGLDISEPDEVVVTIINVNDPPSCDSGTASVAQLWPPNHKMDSIHIVGVTDPDDDTVTIAIVGISQDEMTNGLGDGDSGPDGVIQGDSALLRAERSGGGNGRVYEVQFSADDGQGGVCDGAVRVEVPLSMKTAQPVVDDGQIYDATLP